MSRKTAWSKGGKPISTCWVFVKKTLAEINAGVWVNVGEGIRVAVGGMVGLEVLVGAVVGVKVLVGVLVGTSVAVGSGVLVGV